MKTGEDAEAAHNQWWWDMYPNLFFDDWLWAHMIRGAEWLWQVDWTKINDLALLSLLRMGVLDWKAPNDCLHQATQAIQHRTAMALHFLPRILKLESQVREKDVGLFDSPNLISFRLTMLNMSGELMEPKFVGSRRMPRRTTRRCCRPPIRLRMQSWRTMWSSPRSGRWPMIILTVVWRNILSWRTRWWTWKVFQVSNRLPFNTAKIW